MSEILAKIDVNDYGVQSMVAGGGSQPNLQSKDVTITENGTTTITADTGYDALSDVDVTVSGILDTSDATATASDIASGKTAYANGLLVTGTFVPSPEILDSKAVKFYDYDGTLVDGYTKEEFLALTSLPANPTHVGLTAQGWNWTLADAKTYVTNYDELNIGQTYVTSDNKTRLYIDLTEGRLAPVLGVATEGLVAIDWGDNSYDSLRGYSTSEVAYIQHTYDAPGSYVITLDCDDDIHILGDASKYSTILTSIEATLNANTAYRNCLTKIELGNNVIIDNYAFWGCSLLETINLPNNITSIGKTAFENCTTLKNIVLPNNLAQIPDRCFSGCRSLKHAILSNSITTIPYNAFQTCDTLREIIIPSSCTSLGNYAFSSCTTLENIKIPANVSSIVQNAFANCRGLKTVKIYNSNAYTVGTSAFSSCDNLKSVILGSGLQSISDTTFSGCIALKNISLPEGVTSIGRSSFYANTSLTYIKFPSTLTSIKASAFQSCYGMGVYDFTDLTSVPALNNSNAFDGMPTDCIIVVPDDLYEEWLEASGWVNLATHIIDERNWHIQPNP